MAAPQKLSNDIKFLLARNRVRLHELAPRDVEARLLELFYLPADRGERDQRILRAVREQHPLLFRDWRQFLQQLLNGIAWGSR